MANERTDYALAVEHPELVVLDLLQHALVAARDALAVVHPEIDLDRILPPLDEQCHLAMLIEGDMTFLQEHLRSYRIAVETAATVADDDPKDERQVDLPF